MPVRLLRPKKNAAILLLQDVPYISWVGSKGNGNRLDKVSPWAIQMGMSQWCRHVVTAPSPKALSPPDSDSLCAFGKPTPFPIRNSAIVAYHHIQARCLAKKCLPFQYLTDYQISNGEIKGHNNFRTGNTEMRGPMEGVGKTYYFPTSTYVIWNLKPFCLFFFLFILLLITLLPSFLEISVKNFFLL